SVKRNYGRGVTFGLKEGIIKFIVALPPLFLVVLVLGGILAGFFTATEAAAIAVI
ncbi:MAG: TRAP transporter large permease subunit, partial [Phycisphaerae bacterium]|nr:TRAP transporter large permease subunit [Phycisphaerae bacterium]